MKKNISVLEKVIQDVYQSKTLEEAQNIMILFIESTKVKEIDKRKMLIEVKNSKSLTRLQFYATNSLFKFEGLGVGEFIT
jgi:hypothetical protein